MLAAAPRNTNRSPILRSAHFQGATFQELADFENVTFDGVADFRGATFKGEAWFGGRTAFESVTWFEEAIFEDLANFGAAILKGKAWFGGVSFKSRVNLTMATFESLAYFGRATFQGDVTVDAATFGEVDFAEATFELSPTFNRVTVESRAEFRKVVFQSDVWFSEASFHGDIHFTEASFHGTAVFDGARFRGEGSFGGATLTDARFHKTTFEGDVDFARATLGDALFRGAKFNGDVTFGAAAFKGDAMFDGATFRGEALLDHSNFGGQAWFDQAKFNGETRFDQSTFERAATFRLASFQKETRFYQATFAGEAIFDGAAFAGQAVFDEAIFQRARQLGPMLVRKSLVLDHAVFHERVQVEVSAAVVCCRRARFLAGVQLRVRRAQVALDGTDLAAPSILTGAPPFSGLEEKRWAQALERLWPGGTRGTRPRLISLRGTDVAGLTVAGVVLCACRFTGAHHLDQLRVEDVEFPYTPRGWRWITRQTIAEEHHWRAHRRQGKAVVLNRPDIRTASSLSGMGDEGAGWYHPANRPPVWLDVELPTPTQIAALYRALRKGREDSKDEPGAADLYYGEMEMRRHATREEAKAERRYGHYRHWATATTEHAVLWLYWLVAGYGLRAWRALAALVVVIGLVGVGFSRVGFHHPHPSQVASWLYALQATVSLEGKAQQLSGQLTLPGELLRVGLRLTGPVLLGLALLSIRGRVKR